jgi:lysophospholipase L1-like esterase
LLTNLFLSLSGFGEHAIVGYQLFMKLQNGTKLLFIGDSITDADRGDSGETTPWDPPLGLGRGYVNLVNAMITAQHPEKGIRVVNRGISGNTVLDLESRWDVDVLAYKPNWLSVMIGINDVWRQFDTPLRVEGYISPDRYEATLRSLLERTRPDLSGLILMSPYVIDSNLEDGMRQRMDEYGEIVHRLAEAFDAIFVDTQAAFDQILKHMHASSLAWDRIHPGTAGHMVIANAFMAAIQSC